ncbi:MAG: cytochrome oxidase subunit III [Saprospiraceae bacterium]|nr:MAG: cytochrome oxidase subunit III [Saprospiraceae bacterium]
MDITAQNTYKRNKIHPMRFALWIGCASILMMFAGLTSAYVVREAGGNWLEYRLPDIFFISTVMILLSSITIHGSYLAFKKGNEGTYRALLWATMVLGVAFLICQYQGWLTLQEIGVPLGINPSGDFIYVISGLHAAHLLGGICILLVALMNAYTLKFKQTQARMLRFKLSLTYWHFVGLLWVYLFVFFTLHQA